MSKKLDYSQSGLQMLTELNAYGLLYIDPLNKFHANLSDRHNAIDVYLLCAATCSRSFRALGVNFKIISNDKKNLLERLQRLHISDLDVVQYTFTLPVPSGIPFYAAHFKLEVLCAFGTGELGQVVAMVDVDAILLRPLKISDSLGVFDISEQVEPAYGREKIFSDLKVITGNRISAGRWFGGEFILGHADHFAALSRYIKGCWSNYLPSIDSLHHVGDEMVLSAALNMYSEQVASVDDYGKGGDVARWWSSRTLHKQMPFSTYGNVSFLHLPADKDFLSKYAHKDTTKQIMADYKRYVQRKLISRSFLSILERMQSKPKKFTPSLT